MRRRLTDGQIFFRSLLALICTVVATVAAFVLPNEIGALLCHFFCGPGPTDFNVYFMYGFFIGIILPVPVALYGLYHTLKPWVYPYVAMKEGHCQRCGYNLRGLGSDSFTCPECGEPTANSG